MLALDPDSPVPLIQQLVDGLKQLIQDGKLRPGAKLPSIRQFASAQGVSTSTIVEGYDRLVAEGFLVPRQGSGFFVRSTTQPAQGVLREQPQPLRHERFDPMWFVRRIWEARSAAVTPGYGWIPDDWLDESVIRRGLRALSARPRLHTPGYGSPAGLPSLRVALCDMLAERDVAASPEQILLTAGASHALELIASYLVRPGDVVLVDEPGYSVMMATLRNRGARLVGVPWTQDGVDLDVMERLVIEHRPRAFFTNARLQNPTGLSYSARTMHRVLQLADRHDVVVVEDDVCAALDDGPPRSLAGLDALSRVIHVGSFSKSISPTLRVGFVAAHVDVIEGLTQTKMTTGLTTSELTEQVVLEILREGRYRKHTRVLRERLAEAHDKAAIMLERAGWLRQCEPKAGLFLWARHPEVADAALLGRSAIDSNILLAPGHLFQVNGDVSPWVRFNVGFCDSPVLSDFLAGCAGR
jgi:DNA-binding transcriptional MocR family regulator